MVHLELMNSMYIVSTKTKIQFDTKKVCPLRFNLKPKKKKSTLCSVENIRILIKDLHVRSCEQKAGETTALTTPLVVNNKI